MQGLVGAGDGAVVPRMCLCTLVPVHTTPPLAHTRVHTGLLRGRRVSKYLSPPHPGS